MPGAEQAPSPGDDEALDAVVAERPRAGRQPAVGIDDDADGMRPADPPHREQGIVGDRRSDPDDHGIDDGAQPVEMVEPVAAVDVVRMPGHGRGAAVERLADLPDHHEVVHQTRAQRPENALPARRRVAQAGADRGERVAPAGIVTSVVWEVSSKLMEHRAGTANGLSHHSRKLLPGIGSQALGLSLGFTWVLGGRCRDR